MTYHFTKKTDGEFDDIIDRVVAALKEQGFGILTEVDVRATLKKKLDVDFRNYRILGACNPALAWQALQVEDKIGTMLPCNIIVQELDDGTIEISAVDPLASMMAIENPELKNVAETAQAMLKSVIDAL